MKPIIYSFCLTGFLWLAIACRSSYPVAQSVTLDLTVASETRIGYGVGPQTCMLVKYSSREPWQYMYSEIEGFEYEPGYEYQLVVLRTERKNPPQDASRYCFSLKKILSKKKVQSVGLSGK